jgi:hypothetical protein
VGPLPDDIANLCVIFHARRSRPLSFSQLEERVRTSRRLGASATPAEIISESLACGLIELTGPGYGPTKLGRSIGKAQGEVQHVIQDVAKSILREKVYLRHGSGERCCGHLLREWKPDVDQGTFIYERDPSEDPTTLWWLQVLERVGLISVDRQRALVKQACLGAVNTLLAQLRGAAPPLDPELEALRVLIGDIGEELAVQFERERLRACDAEWLIPAVQRISLVDESAGYDIVSCRGWGKRPDAPIFIEVKATTADQVQFFWSRNERRLAAQKGGGYWIYAYTELDIESRDAKGPYRIQNPTVMVRPPLFDVEAIDVFVTKRHEAKL